MDASVDFVMPKLGLTMVEGTVARWNTEPGRPFGPGDVLVVVETDKIAYEVEAPAAGIFREVLVAEGTAVPVGTPIGRWDLGDLAAAPAPGQRIVATPHARRLAREAGIDLGLLTGSGPGARIKGIDVSAAMAARRPPAAAAQQQAPSPARQLRSAPLRAATVQAAVEVDVTRLIAINEEIVRAMPALGAGLSHYVALATARLSTTATLIGLVEGPAEAPALVDPAACRTLSDVIAATRRQAGETPPAAATRIWIATARAGISWVATGPPAGWDAALWIGAVHRSFRPDADGRPRLVALTDLVLEAHMPPADAAAAQNLLLGIRAALQQPLHLLVT
jgi:pyruvate dehydrogenase E2 component (dihydrolipoamide acetyltransferase)